MATNFSCCDLHFNCLDCPIITGPDCIAPNNLLPGQMWYNPCTCTYYFSCSGGFDQEDNCETYTPVNHKAGAGISYSGNCEEGSYISVKILPNGGLVFEGDGSIRVDCDQLIENCNLWHAGTCEEMIEHCELWTRNNLTFNEEDFALVCDPVTFVCELKLNPETPIVRSRNAGVLASAGLCLSAAPTGWAGPISGSRSAYLQMRDRTWISGSGTNDSGTGPGYLTEVFTNNWSTDALLEVDLIAQCNALGPSNASLLFTHSITDTLAVSPVSFGAGNSPALPNWCYTQISCNTPSFDPNPPPEGNTLTNGLYSPMTGICKYTRVMAPGETVTLYYQWWVAFNELYGGVSYVVHGGMATASKMTRSVIPL